MSSNILLNVLDIYLDTDNPRHEPIYDQSSIIKHLLKDERVRNLAKHIADHGVNPLDSIGVVKDEESNYVVVEGNRRLCALLLLNDPEKAPSGEAPYFKKLAESSTKVPNAINCVLFDDSDEANIWMGVRHNGEQDGVGVKNWDSKQKTRHNGRTNKKDQNALALSLLDYAVKKGFLHSEKTDRIITTASRYLGNPFIRETFGIVSPRSEQEVKLNVSCSDFDIVIQRFCTDLVENTIVNSRSRKDDWVSYGRSLIENSIAPKERVSIHLLDECLSPENKTEAKPYSQNEKQVPLSKDARASSETDKSSSVNGNTNVENPASKAGRNNQNPDNRKYLIPHDFKVVVNNKILRRTFEEMRTITVDEKPLAVALITRAFLENLYILFYEKVTGRYQPQQTHILMDKVIKEIQQDQGLARVEKDSLAALQRVQSNQANVLSPKTLGANAHAGIYPSSTELKREFDNIAEIIKYMLKRI